MSHFISFIHLNRSEHFDDQSSMSSGRTLSQSCVCAICASIFPPKPRRPVRGGPVQFPRRMWQLLEERSGQGQTFSHQIGQCMRVWGQRAVEAGLPHERALSFRLCVLAPGPGPLCRHGNKPRGEHFIRESGGFARLPHQVCTASWHVVGLDSQWEEGVSAALSQ